MSIPLRTSRDTRELRARIATLPDVRARIAKRAAVEFTILAKADYDAQRSPDGEAWEPGRKGTPKHKRSGTLENAATTYEAVGTRVRVSAIGVPYARYQRPGDFIPKDLPPAFLAKLREISIDEITKHLTGRS